MYIISGDLFVCISVCYVTVCSDGDVGIDIKKSVAFLWKWAAGPV